MKINVLDYGYVRYVEHYGKGDTGIDEAGIIEAARQSVQGNFKGWEPGIYDGEEHPGDSKLLKFLHNNVHTTPFEFAGLIVEVKAPILVLREWHRHRTMSYNEMSARYGPLPDVNYLPNKARLFLTSEKNKQAQALAGSRELTDGFAELWHSQVDDLYKQIEDTYQLGLLNGVPKELARIVLPVGRYSQMRANANLLNWLRFLTLRYVNPNAQWEIRQYGKAVAQIVEDKFPQTWNLFKTLHEILEGDEFLKDLYND